jgi:CDGSH-type Zn-finger protein
MDLPKIATRHSIKVELKANEQYYWCSCGLSANQPFCDGSHKGTKFTPKAFTVEQDKIVGLCGCKYAANGPFCDGAHKKLAAE